eukprot:11791769-Karenia_brevis.AAC.1
MRQCCDLLKAAADYELSGNPNSFSHAQSVWRQIRPKLVRARPKHIPKELCFNVFRAVVAYCEEKHAQIAKPSSPSRMQKAKMAIDEACSNSKMKPVFNRNKDFTAHA